MHYIVQYTLIIYYTLYINIHYTSINIKHYISPFFNYIYVNTEDDIAIYIYADMNVTINIKIY